MIFSIQQDCQKTRPLGTGVFVKCDQRQKINIFEHVSKIYVWQKKSHSNVPQNARHHFSESSKYQIFSGGHALDPLEGHVPMQHAMLVTCMQAQFSLQFRCLFRAS